MRTFIANALILVSTLMACTGCTRRPGYPPLDPTPVLDLATGFVPGAFGIPLGKYLFIESWNSTFGYSTKGSCPGASLIDFPGYTFVDGQLRGIAKPDGNAIGFFGSGTSNGGAMGGGTNSELATITQLPFALPGDQSIQSILKDGTLAVQFSDGRTYWLHPGQSWVEYFESDPDPTCHVISTVRLTNYGLLDAHTILFANTPLAPIETTIP